MSADYVARELGYRMTGGWGQGDAATNAAFRPVETYSERFGALLDEIRGLGFQAVDIWTGHLNPAWATPEHVEAVKRELERRHLSVSSLAGGFGDTRGAFERSCRVAAELGAPVLGGSSGLLFSDKKTLLAVAGEYGVVFGFENHPDERTPTDVRERIGLPAPHLGVCLDTGWFGSYGYSAARAAAELADVLVHVHLKDVREPGGHETCRYGEGVVDLEACVQELRRQGYAGGISVEHEPEQRSPNEDLRASLKLLQGWLIRNLRGTIPAHAGKTQSMWSGRMLAGDYPRSRGENGSTQTTAHDIAGLSPLTRGKPVPVPVFVGGGGTIPAHAGKTAPSRPTDAPGRDYPRSRGENCRVMWGAGGAGGLSPLTRGKLNRIIPRLIHSGTIPAHAGKTRRSPVTAPHAGDYPRSRGENPRSHMHRPLLRGLSPLTRGKRAWAGDPGDRTGTIPAHAGKTAE